MNSKTSKRIVPELRFPEFRDSGNWKEKQLHEIVQFVNEKIPLQDLNPEKYISTENLLPDFMGVTPSFTRPSTGSATQFKINDILISNIRPYLKKIWIAEFEGGASNDVITIRIKHNIDKKYLSHLLKSNFFIDYVMTGAKGVKMPRGDISLIKKFIVSAPLKTAEQQKIANLLSSLDDLIATQAKKIETLKMHKKGLMQQLFPAEGETVPRLRFPEFRNAKSWSEKPLASQLREMVRPVEMDDDQDYSLVTVKRRYGGVETRGVFKGGTIKVKSQFLIKEKDFLISKRQIVHNACGVVAKGLENFIVSNEYSVLEAKPDCDVNFFWYFSQQPKVSASFLASSRGIVIEKMLFDLGYWLKLKFMLPPFAEQQKIGSFLTAIDNLIVAHSNKLEALKNHKKGLMQRLFPLTIEGDA